MTCKSLYYIKYLKNKFYMKIGIKLVGEKREYCGTTVEAWGEGHPHSAGTGCSADWPCSPATPSRPRQAPRHSPAGPPAAGSAPCPTVTPSFPLCSPALPLPLRNPRCRPDRRGNRCRPCTRPAIPWGPRLRAGSITPTHRPVCACHCLSQVRILGENFIHPV